MVFFLYYFITSYNSISIYKITGESDNFVISDGLFIISPEKSYLELGNVDNINSIEIKEIRLFYKKNNKEYTISKNDKNINLLKNTFQYDELFSYNDIKYVKSNLYLEFILNNDKKKEVVKLTLTKDFSNNIIFRKKIDNISDSNEYLDLDEKIPEYIKQNYKLDDKDRKYYFNEKINNIEINYSYFYDSNVYIVEELYDNYIKQYTYYANSKDISYVCFYDNNEIAEFSYNLSNERCISGDCNSTLVDFFVENYLSKIKFY